MLIEKEWLVINDILAEIYTISKGDMFIQKALKLLKMLIPYTKSYFILLDKKQSIISEKSLFIGIKETERKQYIERYYNQDYLKYVYEFAKTTLVYKDSEILEEEIRKRTEFYQNFLKPANIPFGCGILLIQNNRTVGVLSLFRDTDWGDFSDKDMYILNVFKKHFENIVFRLYKKNDEKAEIQNRCADIVSQFDLTKREADVLDLLCKDLSNEEIGLDLVISLSTVKKHIYNIYTKLNVTSRRQLIHFVYGTIATSKIK